jgi:hypothetical protein
MKFVQDRPEENYHTDDDARIYFRDTTNGAPTHVRCHGIGYALASEGDIGNVELAPFELIGVGRFGLARGSSTTKWTGDSHVYGVYQHNKSLLILESHGGGEQGYLDLHTHAMEMFETLCKTLAPERIWNLCYLIAMTENRARRAGRYEIELLFLQNRLKKAKRNHHTYVKILPQLIHVAAEVKAHA